MVKLKATTFDSASGNWVWHVLYDGDTVARIVKYVQGWKFAWSTGEPHGRPDKVRDAIFAAAKEKETILNITQRLTA